MQTSLGEDRLGSGPRQWHGVSSSNYVDHPAHHSMANIQREAFSNSSSQYPEENSGSTAKYECEYCGKGFNRPSSLRVSTFLVDQRELTIIIAR